MKLSAVARNTTVLLANLSYGLVPAVVFLALLMASRGVFANNPEVDILCRAKAKETAANVYKSCVDEQRQAQLESLKKDYEQKLEAIREQYESELKALGGKNSNSGKRKVQNPKPVTKAAKGKSKAAAAKPKAKSSKLTKRSSPAPKVIELEPYDFSQEEAAGARFEESQMSGAVPFDSSSDESSLDIPEPIPLDSPTDSRSF